MNKIRKVMGEFKRGQLHSGSSDGPKVRSRRQAIAIAMSEDRRMKGKKSKKHQAQKNATKGSYY